MVNKDGRFIRVLQEATHNKKLVWIKDSTTKFIEPNEEVEQAYSLFENGNRIIVYKASRIAFDNFGEEIERVNVNLVVTDNNGKPIFKLSDYELESSADLWTLYKTIQRNESGIDSLMDEIINKYGKN